MNNDNKKTISVLLIILAAVAVIAVVGFIFKDDIINILGGGESSVIADHYGSDNYVSTIPQPEDVIVHNDTEIDETKTDTTEAEVTDPADPDSEESTPDDTDPSVTDPVDAEPVVTDPVAADPIVTDPVVTEPEPVVTEPVATTPTYRFRNKKLLNQHYEKHGIEMGFDSAASYEAAASAVITNPDAIHKTEAEDGDYVYYVESTNEFVVLSTDGYIRTYFLPSGGKAYYDRQ